MKRRDAIRENGNAYDLKKNLLHPAIIYSFLFNNLNNFLEVSQIFGKDSNKKTCFGV
jgi:hypothetical protein